VKEEEEGRDGERRDTGMGMGMGEGLRLLLMVAVLTHLGRGVDQSHTFRRALVLLICWMLDEEKNTFRDHP